MLTILAPFLRGVWWACLAILVTGWGLRAQPADWILENAQIYTGNPSGGAYIMRIPAGDT